MRRMINTTRYIGMYSTRSMIRYISSGYGMGYGSGHGCGCGLIVASKYYTGYVIETSTRIRYCSKSIPPFISYYANIDGSGSADGKGLGIGRYHNNSDVVAADGQVLNWCYKIMPLEVEVEEAHA